MATLPPLMMKLAMTVSPYPTFPRMREKGQTNRCASYVNAPGPHAGAQLTDFHTTFTARLPFDQNFEMRSVIFSNMPDYPRPAPASHPVHTINACIPFVMELA